jgi:A/G-specific adenine glycosylase
MMPSMPKLLRDLKSFYSTGKRDLPWRRTRDPYHILVSEVMLQQTQAGRVVPYYQAFIKQFPTAKALANAPLMSVLKAWQGLGYNRRAKYLYESAKIITEKGFGERLPGVGPYTRAAVEAFAYNKPGIFIETNIRTVFIHYFFPRHKKVSDEKLLPLIEQALKKSKMEPREFYSALMDYGTHLKRSGVHVNARSKHYVKQSRFEGSSRQLRGAIMRELLKKPQTLGQLTKNLSPRTRGEVAAAVTQLQVEALVARSGREFRPAG